MLWNLVRGVAGTRLRGGRGRSDPRRLTVVGVLTTTSTILRADDLQTEVRNALTDWVIDKVADRVVTPEAGRIPRDRRFESISLQRRIQMRTGSADG